MRINKYKIEMKNNKVVIVGGGISSVFSSGGILISELQVHNSDTETDKKLAELKFQLTK